MWVQQRLWSARASAQSGLEVIKLLFMLISAEHEIFSANKYENANNSLRNNCIKSKICAKEVWNKVFEIFGQLPYQQLFDHPID